MPPAEQTIDRDVFPQSLSPSRAGDFLTCPLMYRFRTIDQLPSAPSAAAVRGTLVHEVLEKIFDLAPQDRNLDFATGLFAEAWINLCEADETAARTLLPDGDDLPEPSTVAQMIVEPARPLLETYFAMEDPATLEPHAREMALSATLDSGLTIRGFVDRVDRSATGLIRIVDYKTGKSPSAGFETKAMFQMRFYALAWWRLTGELPELLQLMFLGNAEFVRYSPDASDLEATERKILAIRDAISLAADRGDFRPTPSRLCGWCDFKQLCPEFGGTPPPLPQRSEWISGSSRVTVALEQALHLNLQGTNQQFVSTPDNHQEKEATP